ncbi:MAG: metallophosphoesterase [Bacteriovoracaceae bacterium]|nr:metallophosphoesterase [Bacteriovoracaceae bacterium]
MRFHQKSNITKTVIVISDIHLGAGARVHGRRNFLEDFHYDKEMVEFLEYFSAGHYLDREVELIINGDFFDLLAVPFIQYFDDEFWSEKAALEKLKFIINAHREVIQALVNFASFPKNRIVYIVGNHDAEMIFDSLGKYFLDLFPEKDRSRVKLLHNHDEAYLPVPGIVIKHGHEYELAHAYDPKSSIAEDQLGNKYFIPPWGSYYVTRVINKFKEGRDYINAVRPVNKFIINGLIYDSLYTFRFLLANFYYFLMVRFLLIFKQNKTIAEVFKHAKNEITLFQDYEALTENFIKGDPNVKALIVGHTHDPIFREYDDGSIFINTGTWTKMYNLDFSKNFNGARLTYAKIDVRDEEKQESFLPESDNANQVQVNNFSHLDINLFEWRGRTDLPFKEFR